MDGAGVIRAREVFDKDLDRAVEKLVQEITANGN